MIKNLMAFMMCMSSLAHASLAATAEMLQIEYGCEYVARTQPQMGGFAFDPVEKEKPVVWIASTPRRIILDDGRFLFVLRNEGYPDKRIVVHLTFKETGGEMVRITIIKKLAQLTFGQLTAPELSIIEHYVCDVLKAIWIQ